MKSADGRFEYRDRLDKPVPADTPAEHVHRVAFPCRYPGANKTSFCSLNLRGRDHDVENRSWTWNGNVDKPTLMPSVNCKNCWHGYVIEGEFRKVDKITLEKVQ